MATINPSFYWQSEGMRIGNFYCPILVLHLNNGTAIENNDVISETSANAIRSAFASQVSIGDMIVGGDTRGHSFPGIQSVGTYTVASYTYPSSYSSDLLRGHTVSLKKTIETKGYDMTLITTRLYIDDVEQTTPQAQHSEAYNQQGTWLCFGSLHLIYDDIGKRFLYLQSWGSSNFSIYEGLWTDYNQIGIINYKVVPTASPVCDTSTTLTSLQLGFVGARCNAFLIASVGEYSDDPYFPVPTSVTGGGRASYDWTSTDPVDFPADPGVSAVNTGFISLWAPTEEQMLKLSSYMWNADILTIDFWKRLWADPLDVIYGLHIIPVDFRATGRDVIGGTDNVVVGLVNTKVPMDYLKTQWIEVDCGELDLEEVWGAYIDYDPYTKLEIYLPYCGVHPLRVDDFMAGTISLKYKIDLLTGSCVAMLKSTKSEEGTTSLDSIIYQFMGNCSVQIPVTASQFADAVRSTISLAASVGSLVATNVGGAVAAASGGLTQLGKARLAEANISQGGAAVENVMGIKPAIERSGALGASAGLLAVQTPYLIITRPRQAHPDEQNRYTGYPSFITETLGDLTGWTIVKAIHLEDIECTADELAEIDTLLKEGVIF